MRKISGAIVASLMFAFSNSVFPQEIDDNQLDLTITVMPQDANSPSVVTGEITLPPDEAGNVIPSEADVDGQAIGETAAEAAEENRESIGRDSLPAIEDLLPDLVPLSPPSPDDAPPVP